MITAQDILTKNFEQSKSGYSADEVDRFNREVAETISAMEREKEDNEKKMAVLVESIRAYKQKEADLSAAMLDAQKYQRSKLEEAQIQADQIIAEAQQKAEQIIAAANVKSDEIVGSSAIRAQKERAALEEIQNSVKTFKKNLLAMYKEHLELITSIPADDDDVEPEEAEQAEEAAEETVTETVSLEKGEVSEESFNLFDDMESTKVIDTSSVN